MPVPFRSVFRFVVQSVIGSPDLAWWQLQEAVPRTALTMVVGLAAGLVGGLGLGLLFGPILGFGIGLPVGLVGGFFAAFKRVEAPARSVRIRVEGVVAGFLAGLLASPLAGFSVWFVALLLGYRWIGGFGTILTLGLLFGLLFGLTFGLVGGLAGVPGELAGVTSPWALLARDRQVAFLFTLTAGLVGSLVFGLMAGFRVFSVAPVVGSPNFWFGAIFGLGVGLAGGTGLSVSKTEWPSYMPTRGWLALRRRLPWPLMGFLTDAHRRGVLRQAGTAYQFRHIELQHRLATRDADKQQADSSPAATTGANG